MIENLFGRNELAGFARKQSRATVRRSVKSEEASKLVEEGWSIYRKGKRSVGVEKEKQRKDLLESRVWTLMHRLGFTHLSAVGGAWLSGASSETSESTGARFDVVAVDDEIGICVDCKSFDSARRDSKFGDRIEKLAEARKRFGDSIARCLKQSKKRHVGAALFTWEVVVSDAERSKAAASGISLFDVNDLEYFEALGKLLGPAARFQFLAEMFRGRKISGLEIRIPALRSKMGSQVCYCFAIRPSYLLKIAYVAHRAMGKSIDIDTYQRMISKSRLKDIGRFISNDGMFPTNVVVNIENSKNMRFERGKQEGDGEGAQFGWLSISGEYGSAWIIDGQHRLYAYSGHCRSETSFLNVLAFEGLSPPKQAQIFVDVNSEQRRVKRSLLLELDAALKWESEDIEKRIDAIISKSAMALDGDMESPLRNRVLLSDVTRTDTRCISLTAIAAALGKSGFYVASQKKGVTEFGPLWRDDPKESLKRTVTILRCWFGEIASASRTWWELGAAEGGGLAMNNGVTVCINVLRSVFEGFQSSSVVRVETDQLENKIRPYGNSLGEYFSRMTAEDRLRFRQLQGVDGQTTGTRMCQEAIRKKFQAFNPPGLDEWIRTREANTNEEGRQLIVEIERALQDFLISELKEEFDSKPDEWWFEGVPKAVRKKIDERINETDGKAGERERNFDIVHYREIIKENWGMFGQTLGFGPGSGAKDARTKWLVEISDMRNVVMHPSRREHLSFEKLAALRAYKLWLDGQLKQHLEVESGT